MKDTWMALGCPLSMEKEILAIRVEIKLKNKHKKERLVLVKSAYNEMRARMGKKDRELKCGARCIHDINKQLNIWLALYDKRTPLQRELSSKSLTPPSKDTKSSKRGINSVAPEDELKSLESRIAIYDEMDYNSLIAEVKKAIGLEKYNALKKNNNNRLLKASLLKETLLNH